ncbi:ribosome hibernation-promoting factor, HPF/YfiA family [Aeromicrobium wangtongii]|uniref:Ribosome hibernation promoting factor n=1 Tax=Aeromicrobium wangtongii TaxID=2969247 RepID=A0ABY5MBN6_9ACTN|nr:ribosome-associated translation inhibitor RaiA [Aeromicrobium wangtongii]MCD9197073.1 ribosome-associated translation inhibitor RaiA [Aeromicrobium wangtongii]MCL3817997.1 ribosome-associated translation inhibitor RaiA [Aeromicrobium wangtongii]UUP14574.1 ribosome-associated translation inhibitor RaiA [Aeromicrobium wangtongii]
MEIVVNGRNSEISESFKERVADKLLRLEKYDSRQKINRVEVEVTHEKNPRQHDTAAKVEMTLRSRGPAVRAEATSTDQHSALDAAIDKLESRLRRAVDRQRIHRGEKRPTSVAEALATTDIEDLVLDEPADDDVPRSMAGPIEVQGDCPLVVREKTHQGTPMTLEQAMYEMELVGHDFYLFMEKDSMRPSVVYLRKGYDYGVIHLDVTE